jgi:hypothetical protein
MSAYGPKRTSSGVKNCNVEAWDGLGRGWFYVAMLAIWLAALWFLYFSDSIPGFLACRRFRLGGSTTAIGGDGLKASLGR